MPGGRSDSAGVPFTGRHFDHGPASDDDGSAPPALMAALRDFRAGRLGLAAVVDIFRDSRVLIPLVARLGEEGLNDRGSKIDKSAELSIVTVAGPDGRTVMPVFSSLETMGRWNPAARPVPADAVRVALAVADEDTDLVVLDPTSESEFVLRRPALWAIARSEPWTPSYLDGAVLTAFLASSDLEPDVVSLTLEAGDLHARLLGPELLVRLYVVPGLARDTLDSLLDRLHRTWSNNEIIALRVDSLALRVRAAVA